jgi:hypothetical protein
VQKRRKSSIATETVYSFACHFPTAKPIGKFAAKVIGYPVFTKVVALRRLVRMDVVISTTR